MEFVTLILALLLGAGFVFAQAAKRIGLPSVTGYILAGLLLGPSGAGVIDPEIIGPRLNHFTQIALMLIAFGVGEHLEWKRFKRSAGKVFFLGFAEAVGGFVCVTLVFLPVSSLVFGRELGPAFSGHLSLALLLGGVAMATAPASTLHVIREERACGPLAATLMQVVALDNGLAIFFFGIVSSVAHQLGGYPSTMGEVLAGGLTEIIGSLALGVACGLAIEGVVHRLEDRGEILTAGLALLLLCGETARLFQWSPLLSGMAAGCTVVNRDRRDVRFFRAVNAFETPVYVLFFTLAGLHLDISAYGAASLLGLLYFASRVCGKILGVRLAHRLSPLPKEIASNLGVALAPQAGLAIGLLFLAGSDPKLEGFAGVMTAVVLVGVLVAEIFGPAATKAALSRAGESGTGARREPESAVVCRVVPGQVAPWQWGKLARPSETSGTVLFGISHHLTVRGLARIAILLAHGLSAEARGIRIHALEENEEATRDLFAAALSEAGELGYPLAITVVESDDPAAAMIDACRATRTRALVLGYPAQSSNQAFQRLVERVTADAPCQVVVARLAGPLHTECILVVVGSLEELSTVETVTRAISLVGRHRLTCIGLFPDGSSEESLDEAARVLDRWAKKVAPGAIADIRALAAENRAQVVLDEMVRHDLVIIPATQGRGMGRYFFGSLAETVARQADRPVLMVHAPPPQAASPDRD